MGLFSACFRSPSRDHNVPRETPRYAPLSQYERYGMRRHIKTTVPPNSHWIHRTESCSPASHYDCPTRNLTARQHRSRKQNIPVSKAAPTHSHAYHRSERLAAFKRWEESPVEVQQDVERCVRDDELLRRGTPFGQPDYRVRRVDDPEGEYQDALTRAVKRKLRLLARTQS